MRWHTQGQQQDGSRGVTRGQVTVEIALLVGVALAALIVMSVYVQRAYQGYLYANTSTVASTASSQQRVQQGTFSNPPAIQFDLNQPYAEHHRLNALTEVQEIDLTGATVRTRLQTDFDVSAEATYHAR